MNRVEKFLNENFGEVRVIEENGILLFVAQDIAKVLQYDKATDLTRNLEDDEKGKQTLRTPGGDQELTIINESGLYNAILSITKRNKERYELSRDFKRWVTNEIIPTIRNTGGFVEEEREEEFVNKYFPSFSEDVKLSMVQDLLKTNKELKVKANKWDQFKDTDSTYSFTDVAKMISTKATEEMNKTIKISNQALTKYLRENGILSKNKSGSNYTNVPNIEYEDYFNVSSVKVKGKFDKTQTRVKSNGVEFIYDMLILNEFEVA